jgi:hypothetical protein
MFVWPKDYLLVTGTRMVEIISAVFVSFSLSKQEEYSNSI